MNRELPRPMALLLDFGGVIVDAPALPPAPTELVNRVHEIIEGALSRQQIERDLVQGARAYSSWRDDISRRSRPFELSHEQVFRSFITPDWPTGARKRIHPEVTALCYAWTYRPDWTVLPGIPELLEIADNVGIPVAIVSNTLCGAAHRDFLEKAGLGDRFAVQLYSDEIGIRKPNPEMAWHAARLLRVRTEDCWFVGDSPSRDIACAKRAGVGAAVLVHSSRTRREGDLITEPSARLDSSKALCDLVATRTVT